MNVFRRSFFYIFRKRGQTVTLFLLFFLISAFLLTSFSILEEADLAAKNLRTSVGGAFYLRPASRLEFKDGEAKQAEGPLPSISEDVIQEIMDGGNLKYCNAINYGYARSDTVDFIPGAGHTEGSNMGKVAAMHYTALADQFLEEKLELKEGRHLTKEDQNKILISEQLAAANDLQVGDRVTFTHAGIMRGNGGYEDSVPQKSAFSEAEIAGIYRETVPQPGDSKSPTPGRGENLIFSDHNFLIALGEQEALQYTGEVNFYVSDPLLLKEVTDRVTKMDTIDWESYSIRENDFQYTKIADSLSSIQHLTGTLILCISIVSILILILILTMRIRGRVHEAGIMLAIGKTKQEIILQFLTEVFAVFLIAFLCAAALSSAAAGTAGQLLFGELGNTSIDIHAVETGFISAPEVKTCLQIRWGTALMLFLCQTTAIAAAVAASCGGILTLKPKEILSKMS